MVLSSFFSFSSIRELQQHGKTNLGRYQNVSKHINYLFKTVLNVSVQYRMNYDEFYILNTLYFFSNYFYL